MMMIAQDILTQQSSPRVWTIRADATVFEAVKAMATRNVGALVVIDAGQVVGIVTERDYTRKIVLEGRSSKTTRVETIMVRDMILVTPATSLDRCMSMMTGFRVRHLPVVDDGRLAGMISIGDVVKKLLEDRDFVIDEMNAYITGTHEPWEMRIPA